MFSLQAKSADHLSAGISLFDNGIALAIVNRAKKKPVLEHGRFYACSGVEQTTLLAQLSKEYKLYDIPCNLVLGPNEYQFHQVDAPDVPKHELNSALRWQIKDLIDFHIDDAVIDKIDLPIQNQASQGKNSLLVIACRQSLIKEHVTLLHAANCKLASIDVAALAARNIISHIESADQDSSIGLLNLWDDMAKISVLMKHDLYINRASSIGLESLAFVSEEDGNSQAILDSLSLELQRTFDYFESHSRQAAISHLFILSNGQSLPNIDELIKLRLGLDCSIIEPSDFITFSDSLNETVTRNCMMAIGGALRMEY